MPSRTVPAAAAQATGRQRPDTSRPSGTAVAETTAVPARPATATAPTTPWRAHQVARPACGPGHTRHSPDQRTLGRAATPPRSTASQPDCAACGDDQCPNGRIGSPTQPRQHRPAEVRARIVQHPQQKAPKRQTPVGRQGGACHPHRNVAPRIGVAPPPRGPGGQSARTCHALSSVIWTTTSTVDRAMTVLQPPNMQPQHSHNVTSRSTRFSGEHPIHPEQPHGGPLWRWWVDAAVLLQVPALPRLEGLPATRA